MQSSPCLARTTPGAKMLEAPPEVVGFVVSCMLTGDVPNNYDSVLEHQYEEVIRFARNHRVLGRIYPRIELYKSGSLDAPTSFLRTKIAEYKKNEERTISTLNTISDALRAGGIDLVILKGLATKALFYDINEARRPGDIDVAVPLSQLRRTAQSLRSVGFDHERVSLGGALRHLHHYSMYSSTLDLKIDVHWRIAPPFMGIRCHLQDALSHTREIKFRGFSFKTLREVDLALLMALENSKSWWSELRKLEDFTLSLKALSETQFVDCLKLADTINARRQLEATVLVCERLGLSLGPYSSDRKEFVMDHVTRQIGEIESEKFYRHRGPEGLSAKAARLLVNSRKFHDLSSSLSFIGWHVLRMSIPAALKRRELFYIWSANKEWRRIID